MDSFSGGYVGVDVFFVVSGFLITSILAHSLDEKRFSIVEFYERRARRILPALFLVILVCLPLAWVTMPAETFIDFFKSIIATITFSSNVLFWVESGYFESATELKPLLHTWSLAVEEQFYIAFPVFLFLIWKLSNAVRVALLIVLTLFSLALAEYASANHPSAGFYLLPTRAWELLFGAIAALYLRTEHGQAWRAAPKTILAQTLSLLGLGLITASIVLFDEHTPFPGLYAVAPVLGTTLIILSSKPGTLTYRILSLPVLVGIGLLSYSAYLWHQPLLAFFRYDQFRELHNFEIAIFVALVFLLSYLSWRFVEKPFRQRDRFSRKQIFNLAWQASAVGVAIGIAGIVMNGIPNRIVKWDSFATADYAYDNRALQNQSWQLLSNKSGGGYGVTSNAFDRELWFEVADPRAKMLIVGNSYSKDLYNTLAYSETAKARFEIARFGTQLKDIRLDSADLYNSPNYLAADVIVICSKILEDPDLQAIPDIVRIVKADNKQLVMVNEVFGFEDLLDRTRMDQIIRRASATYSLAEDSVDVTTLVNRTHFEDFANLRTNKPVTVENRALVTQMMEDLGVILVDRMDLVCDAEAEICFAAGEAYTKHLFDFAHYSLAGAAFFGQRVDELNWLSALPE